MKQEQLITFSSWYIVDFLTNHPVDWSGKEMADRGGAGDLLTPTPAVTEFISLLKDKNNLFGQDEYADYCMGVWADWLSSLSPARRNGSEYSRDEQKKGIWYRLRRNFYPSMIDTLHAWALLAEAQWFSICFINSFIDVVGKVDLSLNRNGITTKVALLGPYQAVRDRDYKKQFRGNGKDYSGVIEIVMPAHRQMGPGRKRWYELGDFSRLDPGRLHVDTINKRVEDGTLKEIDALQAQAGDIRIWINCDGQGEGRTITERLGNMVRIGELEWASLLPFTGHIKVYRDTTT